MNNAAIDKTISFVSEKLNQLPYNKYRLEHTLRVANIGKLIAESEGLDITALTVACLLHDVSYSEEFSSEQDWLNHGRRAAELSKDFVDELDFDDNIKKEVLFGIAKHVDDIGGDFTTTNSAFCESVGDADNIDRFDAYRIYDWLKTDRYEEKTLAEQKEYCLARIARMDKNMTLVFGTPTATKLWQDRLAFCKEFFGKLLSQVENSESIY